MGTVDFQFTPPPEAPTFEPTEEEFQDPLAYIAKIRPIAEKSGICKIKPPPDWQPPFAVDVDNFKFTPRIQRLNELEAKTRIKLNFLDQIAKFWELQGRRTHQPVNCIYSQIQKKLKFSTQGSTLRIPNVERKALDLFTLHKLVQDEGGYEMVTRDRRWSKLSTKMGYPAGRSVGSLLRTHYERILYPYDMFVAGNNLGDLITDESQEVDKKDKDYVPHSIPSRQAIKPPAERYSRRSKRHSKDLGCENDSPPKTPIKTEEEDSVDYSTNNELRKLQFYGAGPKMPGFNATGTDDCEEETFDEKPIKREKGSPSSKMKPFDPIDQIVCHTCSRGDAEESMLLCDGCDDSYHTFCLVPALTEIPKGDWRCPRCVAVECRKPQEAFGFEQATKEYTLQSFGEMADQFKSDYFNMPVHMVPPSVVEKEFWRITGAIDEDVTVEYGADLHTMDHGSGFPTKNSKNMMPGDEEYANCGWNLNNLPVAEGSVLCHINADISGMKIPWMYVGMCFATFCWHNEDHWSYSINYLHWGEPKTWYGVPGDRADAFETSMKSAAPELFEAQPDLLHQLVTIMNPNILMKAGVPVYRTNQNAGEFVVTFPRAYHAGFNQGYNFAEAVNFCPSDWLSIGRHCIDHYSKLRRFCVFSHDELVCKMAADPDSLDLNLAAATYRDMLIMVENEKQLRKALIQKGVTEAEREAFELLPDDERQCEFCKTTCFLSAVTCACSSSLVCIKHVKELCQCSQCNSSRHCLRYRYTLEELPLMLHRLKVRAESFDNWAVKVKNALEATLGSKLELSEMKELIVEAEEKKFPDSELLQTLMSAVQEAEKCASVAQQLVSKKVRTRNRQLGDAKFTARLTLEELQLFYNQVNNLSCEIKEAVLVKDLLDQVVDFQQEAKEVLEVEMPDVKNLEKLIDFGVTLDIDLPEVPNLKQKSQQVRWLEEVQVTLSEPNQVTIDVLRRLLDSGVNLPPHATIERSMAELQELLTQVERWEEKAKICLQARPRHVMATLEAIISEAKNIPAFLPNTLALKDALKRAKEWTAKVEIIQNGEHYPYLEVLENLVNKGRPIPVRLDQLPQVESQVAAAKSWRERTARTFLKKNSTYSLVEVLSPRSDIGTYPNNKNKKKKLKEQAADKEKENYNGFDFKFEEARDPATIVATFKKAEHQEIESMRDLRIKNLQKRAEDAGDSKYCVCRKGLSGFMLQCELCKDWFHATCVPLPKSATVKNKSGSALVSQMAKDLKFLCPLCLRSRRPRLETILSLLVSLQKLPVRLPEGEALQCLTERAMSWQDRARQALATEELAAALAKLSVLSQRMVEQAAREKTEKIISAELLKAASNPELQPHLESMAQSAFSGLHTEQILNTDDSVPSSEEPLVSEIPTEPAIVMDVETSNDALVMPVHGPLSPDLGQSDLQTDPDVLQTYNSSEHAYSSASKTNQGQTPRKHARKSPLVPRQLETPVLELSELAKAQLEELMMEGDLLEVSLDETQHIWRILQATKPRREDKFPDFEDLENDYGSDKEKEKKKKLKKRKMDDIEGNRKFKVKDKLKVKKEDGKNPDDKPKKRLKFDSNGKPIKKILKSKEGNAKDGEVKREPKEMNSRMKMKKLKPTKKRTKDGDTNKTNEKGERKRVKRELEETDTDDDDDDIDDNCAAAKCIKPTGQEVNWVQCDGGCEQWFHWVCVGLKKGDISENEDYICVGCSKRKPSDLKVRKQQSDSGKVKQKFNKPQGKIVKKRVNSQSVTNDQLKEECTDENDTTADLGVSATDNSSAVEVEETESDVCLGGVVDSEEVSAKLELGTTLDFPTELNGNLSTVKDEMTSKESHT